MTRGAPDPGPALPSSTARADRLVGAVMVALSSTSVLAVVGALSRFGLLGPPWWAWPLVIALAVAYGTAVVRAVVGRAPGPGAAALVVTGLLPLVTAPAAGTAAPAVGETGWPWHTAVAAMTGAAVLLRRMPPARGAAVLGAFGLLLAQLRALPPTSTPDGSRHLVDAAFLVALGVAVFASTRGVEDVTTRIRLARTDAASAEAEARALAASEVERARWEAAVHDDVLSALRAAELADGAEARRAAAVLARRALSRLATDPEHLAVGAGALLGRVRSAVDELGQPVHLEVRCGHGAVPAPVADAVTDAVVELVRNARRHNGPGVSVRITGRIGGDDLELRIADDGRGFQPGAVSPARLGIRVSVEGRMRAVGGEATVSSAPGRGTTAQLAWRR